MHASLKYLSVLLALSGFSQATGSNDECQGHQGQDPETFFCRDKRLGPASLPKESQFMIPDNHPRLGLDADGKEYTIKAFLQEHYTDKKTGKEIREADRIIYPEKEGFVLNEDGTRILGNITLQPGTLVDRIGKENGQFMAVPGTPFDLRAIPPFNLNPGEPSEGEENKTVPYYLFRVKKPLKVLTGPILPWYGQKGYGTQFVIPLDEHSQKVRTMDLVKQCVLERINRVTHKPIQVPEHCSQKPDDEPRDCSREERKKIVEDALRVCKNKKQKDQDLADKDRIIFPE